MPVCVPLPVATTILNSVPIGSVWAKRRQNDGMGPTKAEVHPSLEACALPGAHFEVRNDVIAQKLSELRD